MTRDQFDRIDIENAKARERLSDVFEKLGIKVKGKMCLCPFHIEKTPSCKVDDRKGRYECFACGEWGDHFDILQHMRGLSFVEAVEELGGVRPATPEERRKIEERQVEIEKEDAEEAKRKASRVQQLVADAQDWRETLVEQYLANRGIVLGGGFGLDLKFAPRLGYYGFADAQAEEIKLLGEYPAMLGKIRDERGAVIGVHRTYLDPAGVKLAPPGDAKRNKAKKITGDMRGGLIWLTRASVHLGMGEGIETTFSWYLLGGGEAIGWDAEATSLAAGVSVSNISGRCTGRIRHPRNPAKTIPNGIPDLNQPGIVLPKTVHSVALLGDGDSDEWATRQCLVAGGNRFKHQGVDVFVSMADAGVDFNDMLVRP
ncbi:CHC2 zinc finger domain-containing protein [Bradyrhizobium sp. Leo121]|uniref:DUF7146 domain-containing protein n=1 Tax=Bradyrhizobium sp. Leo121 TaxID=1571195 RepID=UPI00102A380C|nr:CHC2 zinc finger domain-containing protein [Bradyrhizobium sp. Leo121]RZN30488.1 hypothetical protein CWO90_20340 [Bradyrhizobium sp. Leo121]